MVQFIDMAGQLLNLGVPCCSILTESCIFGHQRLYLGVDLLYLGDEAAQWDVNKEQLITGVVKLSAAQLHIYKKNETVVDW